jgi:chromosomal replication initiator protein
VPDVPPDELTSLWQRVSEELRSSLPPSTYKLWLEPLRAVSVQGSTLYLSAPDSVRTWAERRYGTRLLAALRHQAPELTEVEFVVEVAPGQRVTPPDSATPRSLPIDEGHTFERFVIGPGNRLAHAAALAVAELPGDAYNPLFLHGPPGLGKTHLLGAVAEYLRRNHAELTVHYTTAERFTSEFVTALRNEGPERFKARYRELDALLIDDVQVLEGKQRTEEEFVHTFNALHAAGKQIVLSSDRPPDALSQLAERLRDRFQWGLCVEIDPPDLRTRIALLWRIASDTALELPDPTVLREIAALAPGNIRRLEGAMTRVVAFASMLSEPLSQPLVGRALGQRSQLPKPATGSPPTPSLEAIQDAVCSVLGVSRTELISPRRTPRVARARQLAMYLSRELTSLSLAQIARAFDRDHTTVLHAVRAVSGRLEPGSDTAEALRKTHSLLGCTQEASTAAPPDTKRDPIRPSPTINRTDTSDPSSRNMTSR